MGNITSLSRDNFGTNNYTGYTGNQLTQISGFTNSSYVYDENGNLKSDSQKGINLSYNYLNLPTQISGNQNITYTYNAAGQKLKKVSGINTTDYVAGIQYTNGVIEFIQTEEGVARRSGTDYSYEYNLTDHLGNVRATFYKNPNGQLAEVIQRDDYFAFGLRKMGIPNSNLNKYLYNGKELQEELGQYDYGARFYDPVIGRWNVVDPLAEKMRRYSPYNYGFNNPIRFVDPDGMEGTDWVKKDNKYIYDDRVVDQKTAEQYQGENSEYIGKQVQVATKKTDGTIVGAINLNSDGFATNAETGENASKSISGQSLIEAKTLKPDAYGTGLSINAGGGLFYQGLQISADFFSQGQGPGQAFFTVGTPKAPLFFDGSISAQALAGKSNSNTFDLSGDGRSYGAGAGPISGSFSQGLNNQGKVTNNIIGVGPSIGAKYTGGGSNTRTYTIPFWAPFTFSAVAGRFLH